LIEWLAKDRCLVTLGKGKDIAAHRAAFESIVREWIRQAPPRGKPRAKPR
jgi:hypothetical protein